MAVQNSGQISLKDVADEFSDSAPHSMSEFFGEGNAPASGETQLADFYGASSGPSVGYSLSGSVTLVLGARYNGNNNVGQPTCYFNNNVSTNQTFYSSFFNSGATLINRSTNNDSGSSSYVGDMLRFNKNPGAGFNSVTANGNANGSLRLTPIYGGSTGISNNSYLVNTYSLDGNVGANADAYASGWDNSTQDWWNQVVNYPGGVNNGAFQITARTTKYRFWITHYTEMQMRFFAGHGNDPRAGYLFAIFYRSHNQGGYPWNSPTTTFNVGFKWIGT